MRSKMIIIISFISVFLCVGLPVQAASAYGIGSVSKVYTTAAVMKLTEEGKINLERPVTEYLPNFTMADERYRDITVRMLLDHTSGLQGSYYTDSMTLGGANRKNYDTLLEVLTLQRLKADPGELSVYCNDGFTLAELVVESVTGMSFTEYIKAVFQESLGLSVLETPQSSFDRSILAPHYLNAVRPLPYESANLIGSGGIYSTAEDVARFFQIFTKNAYERESPVLSAVSVKEMEKPTYYSDAWPEVGVPGAAVAYGLGWDTVEEYPYKAYGIKALSKGGDTTAYHAGVTVLPEENISCAVLLTGGDSGAASLAVQKIIMEYLEEKGALEEGQSIAVEDTITTADIPEVIPEDIRKREGFYASGSGLIEVKMQEASGIELRSERAGHEVILKGVYLGEGKFLVEDSGYISSAGNLMFAEAGTYGQTIVSFRDSAGKSYLAAETTEFSPGLGSSRNTLPMAQKIEENVLEEGVRKRWQKWSEEDYLLVSEDYKSANYLINPMAGFTVEEDMEGYAVGRGMLRSAVQITDAESADFFQQIPGHAGRDLVTVTLEEQGQIRYLDIQNYLFLSESAVSEMDQMDQTVTIGSKKETVWFHLPEEGNAVGVTITVPKNGHFYVYKKEKEQLVCISSSVTGDGSTSLYLPRGGRIAFAGEAGASFQLVWGNDAK